jgi:hypothetical protein
MEDNCNNMNDCSMYSLITSSVNIMKLQPYLNDYCLNGENYTKCKRYVLKHKGEKPEPNLLPDGTILN